VPFCFPAGHGETATTQAATSPEMIEYLQGEDEGGTHRNPGGERIPDEHRPYYGRRWRGRESDVVWAANELKSKGFVTLRNVVPVEEVAALRDKAEDSWCAIARALHAKNLSHCLVWKLRHAEVGGKELEQPFGAYKDARKCAWHTKFTKEYVVHEPGALGSMEQVLGSESALVVGAHRRLLKSLWPLLEKIRPDFLIDERGFLRNQNPHGGYWHKDVVEWTGAVRGTSFSVFVALQDVNQENGVTMFVPWNGDYVAAPHLPAGSVLMYDTVGLLHRAGNHTPPVGAPDVARWVTWTTLVSEAHKEHLCPFQTGERSVFDLK